MKADAEVVGGLSAKLGDNMSFLGFRVGGLGFLLPVSLQCEIIERLQVSPLPNVEPWFSGLLNVRGAVVPVVDLGILFDVQVDFQKKRQLFAIDRGEKTMALWIDGYPQLLAEVGGTLQPLADLPELPPRLQPYVTAAYTLDGQLWLKVEFAALFKTLGQQQTKEIES
ncbi:MAG: chemotaxis protein CheW [Methylococcales bacterium]|nr:chemotaxis protein CheW [Methylococcales bacterium]